MDKVVKPSWAAKVLGIDYSDLPRLDRAWTKRDIRQLHADRPDWLTEARRRHNIRKQQAAAARAAKLDAELTRLGYTAADAGSLDQALNYIDGARLHLMHVTGCTELEADQAAWRRWPESMHLEQADAEAHWGFW